MTILTPARRDTVRRRRPGERGFAMLFVFLMAAAIAIAMYMEMPRVAFETQRAREQRLVDVGDQYQRAVKLYVRKFKKFPSDLDELEKFTNGVRVLRRRYKDPMTGKDDWRLIHANQVGDLTDSINKKEKEEEKKGPNDFISERGHVGQEALDASGTAAVNPALRLRDSDKRPNRPPQVEIGVGLGSTEGTANDPALRQNQGQPGMPQGQNLPGAPGQPMYGQGQQNYGQPAQPGQQQFPQQPGVPQGARPPGVTGGMIGGMTQPGMQPVTPPGVAPGSSAGSGGFISAQAGLGGSGGISAQPGIGGAGQQQFPGQGGRGGANYPMAGQGTATNQPGGLNTAAQGIMNQLTNPSRNMPQGMAGPGGALLAGGVAGVASKYESPGIKVVNEKTKIQEWEFVYDYKKDMMELMQSRSLGGLEIGPGGKPSDGSKSGSSTTTPKK